MDNKRQAMSDTRYAIDVAKVERMVRHIFAEAKVEECRLFTSDTIHRSYDLRLTNPTHELIFKLYLSEGPTFRPKKEAEVLRRVATETGVIVPYLLHHDESLFPWPCALLTRPPGYPLSEILPKIENLDLETIGYEMGRYLAKLHSLPAFRFGEYLSSDAWAAGHERLYTLARLDETLRQCQERGLLPPESVKELKNLFRETPVLTLQDPCLVHGHFHEGNVVVEESVAGYHVTAFINFESSVAWCPEWDLARPFDRLVEKYSALQESLLSGYGSIGIIPEIFWSRLELYKLLARIEDMLQAKKVGQEKDAQLHKKYIERFLASR